MAGTVVMANTGLKNRTLTMHPIATRKKVTDIDQAKTMNTTVVEVAGLLSVLSAAGVEKQLR